jgi:O-antigen/teichoic acid export membrane protein
LSEPAPGLVARLRELWPARGSYRRDVSESLVTNVVLAGLQLASGVLLARLLGAAGRGQLVAIQALPAIIGTFGTLGLQEAMIYFGARERRRIGDYAVSATALILLLAVPIVAVCAALTPWVLRLQAPQTIRASQIYLGLLFVHAIAGLSITAARAAHDIQRWNRLRLVPTALWIAVIGVAAALGHAEPATLALGYLAALFLWAWLALVPARDYYREGFRLCPELWPGLLRYGLPVAFGGTPQVLNQRIDQLIIVGLFADEQLGLYAIAVAWAGMMQLPGAAMTAVAFSKVAGMADAAEQRRFAGRALRVLAGVSVATAVALVAAAPLALPWIFSAPFAAAVPIAIVLTIGAVLRNLVQMAQNLLMGMGRPSVVLYTEWAGFATLLAGLALAVPRLGLVGVAWAVVGANTVALGVVALIHARTRREVPGGPPPSPAAPPGAADGPA